jgi:hypothetical protein
MSNMEQAIRERAYHLWNDAGCPQGSGETFWLTAQREILAQSMGQIGATTSPVKKTAKAKPVASRKRKAA